MDAAPNQVAPRTATILPLVPPIALDEVEAKLASAGVAVGFRDLILLVPPPDRPLALWRRWSAGQLSTDALRWWLPHVWREVVRLPPAIALATDRWIAMFREVGFVGDPPRARPQVPVRAYRGASESEAAGMSWTPSFDLAGWYADRTIMTTGDRGVVFEAVIDPDSILAILRQGANTEIVVDSATLWIAPRHWDAPGRWETEHVEPPDDL